MTQLRAQHRGLDLVQAAAPAERLVLVARALAVMPQLAQPVRDVGVVGGHEPAVAVRAQVLRRIEAEAAEVAETADATAAMLGAHRLRGVLDHDDPPRPRELEERGHVGGMPV